MDAITSVTSRSSSAATSVTGPAALLEQLQALPAEELQALLQQAARGARLPFARGVGRNPALATDSYKASHYLQYPPGTTGMFSYIESRGGEFTHTLVFGLQMILKEYLSQPLTMADVDEAEALWTAHSEPFNRAGFEYIVRECDGHFPLTIRALPEGTVAPVGTPLVTIESTDPQAFWAVSYVEALLLQVWYPITVATLSWHIKEVIRRYLEETSDDPLSGLPFKLHDFGYRGATSPESAGRAGLAHLVSFLGTDTMAALEAAQRYYGETGAAGFSIPAAEHSTITSWGRDGEAQAYANMVHRFAKPGAIFAVVSDSYDLFHAVDELWGKTLRQQVIDSGATLVVRPDSGDPASIVLQVAQRLDRAFGSVVNGKGYRVLKHVRIIQGDGVNLRSIRSILAGLKAHGYSADNVAFGMGGGLHQMVNRDTLRFAMKCSAVQIDGEWRDVFKSPATDPGKRSKAGRLGVLRQRNTGELRTVQLAASAGWSDRVVESDEPWDDAMRTVWREGRLLVDDGLSQVRARAATQRAPLDRAMAQLGA